MAELQMDQDDLARGLKVAQSTISNIITGRTENSRLLPKVATFLAVNLDWLIGATPHKIDMLDDDDAAISHEEYRRRLRAAEGLAKSGAPALRQENPPALAELGLVAIKEIDLALGAGGTYLDDSAVMEVERYFPEQWLRELTDAPVDMLVFARVRGDSMRPTIESGGIVIIDLRKKRIDEQDAIWAVAVADIGMVKRIWANADGSYKIKSDNERVRSETAVDDEMYVLGRVVGGFSKF